MTDNNIYYIPDYLNRGKSSIFVGDTKKFKDFFNSHPEFKFNKNLKFRGEKVPGWVIAIDKKSSFNEIPFVYQEINTINYEIVKAELNKIAYFLEEENKIEAKIIEIIDPDEIVIKREDTGELLKSLIIKGSWRLAPNFIQELHF